MTPLFLRRLGMKLSKLSLVIGLAGLAACAPSSGFAPQTNQSSTNVGAWAQSFPEIASIEPSTNVTTPDANTIQCAGSCTVQFVPGDATASNAVMACGGNLSIVDSGVTCSNNLTITK